MTIVAGTNFYDGDPESQRRQALAMDALEPLEGLRAVDLQWEASPDRRPWLPVVPLLRRDSVSESGCRGRRKPIVSDMLDALAHVAGLGGHRYVVMFNADILLTQACVRVIEAGDKDAYLFMRTDVDRDGHAIGVERGGIDAFAFDVGWWRAHRARFRPYVVGELCYDNVFAAIAMCHATVAVLDQGEVRHELHPLQGGGTGFSDFNLYLATLDARYFSVWVAFHERLAAARAADPSTTARQVAPPALVNRRSLASAVWQAGRNVKGYARFTRQRAAWNRAYR